MNTDLGSSLDAARSFLLIRLSDGPRHSKDLIREAAEQGISERTLFRAKSSLRVLSRKELVTGLWDWGPPSEPRDRGGHFIRRPSRSEP